MELTIEKLVYGGDGLARLPAAGEGERAKTIFVPHVLPGERVEAGIVEDHSAFARARLNGVLEASPLRTVPPCRYFGECGGCNYQHTSYEEQLRLKLEILRETLRRTAKLELQFEVETHASPSLHYRNRARFHVRSKPHIAIGYFRNGSHELLSVRECPISSPLINRVLAKLWTAVESGEISSQISEIELFANASDQHLMVELYLRPGHILRSALLTFATNLAATVPEVTGIACLARSEPHARPTVQLSNLLYGEGAMKYDVSGESYRVSAGAFFQANRFLLPRMIQLAVGERKGRAALDLYSGVGLFAVALARRFERVIAVETSQVSSTDLLTNVPSNVEVWAQSVETYLTSVTLKPDLVLADPPRAGLGSKVCEQINRLCAPEIVYVSCDPATLARDLKQLTSDGWKIAELHLIDLFPQTFHIETCTVLRRG